MTPKKNHCTVLFILGIIFLSCRPVSNNFTSQELSLIHDADSIMRVLTIENGEDLEVLRAKSKDLPSSALRSDDYKRLTELMVATVTHPSQDGVGIAAPQVGINRRVVAVQRFDKKGEPFEVYPNIKIIWTSESTASGPEGCLSVPNRHEDVVRSQEIVIEYADVNGSARNEAADGAIPMVRDTVKGFTAVIFQHEVDHLDGVLYIDKIEK